MPDRPTVLVFDVNETLIDIDSLTPHFDSVFGDARVLREWFGHLIMYSMTLTLSGYYVDFATLAQAALRMTADVHGLEVGDDDVQAFTNDLRNLPPHPDVADGLRALRAKGYRLATLTNSPPNPDGSPLEKAGLADHFERHFSVADWRVYKPSPQLYLGVADELSVPPSACMMVAAHAWDTIGAQAVGYRGALITRPGNAALPAPGVPQPDVIAADVRELAARL